MKTVEDVWRCYVIACLDYHYNGTGDQAILSSVERGLPDSLMSRLRSHGVQLRHVIAARSIKWEGTTGKIVYPPIDYVEGMRQAVEMVAEGAK